MAVEVMPRLQRVLPHFSGSPLSFNASRSIGAGALLVTLWGSALVTWAVGLPAIGADGAPNAATIAAVERRLRQIAGVPRPMGSAGAESARGQITTELTRTGLVPVIHEATYIAQDGIDGYKGGRVRNVLARIPGRASTGTILLVAHYDSVARSPGAGDNGAGVVAVIEALAQLNARGAPRNTVMALFSDGEEVGLLGAKAFMEQHPWAREVDIVLNFDARGNSGPTIMYETGTGDGWLVRAFAKAAPYRFTNSLTAEIYRWMPTSTDFNVFLRYGRSGLNFAFIDGWANHHRASDTPEQLARSSLVQHVALATALASYLAGIDLGAHPNEDLVFFDVLGQRVVAYPTRYAVGIGAAAFTIFVMLVAYGLARNRLTIQGVLLGFGALLAAAITAAAASYAAGWAFDTWREPEQYATSAYTCGVALLTLLAMWSVYSSSMRRVAALNLFAGGITWWAAFALFTSIVAPGASYLFVWPFAGALATFGALLEERASPYRALASLTAFLLGGIPAILLLTPMIRALFAAFPETQWVVAGFLAFSVALILPQMLLVPLSRRWVVPASLAALCVGSFGMAARQASLGSPHHDADYVEYVLDADAGKAIWVFDARHPRVGASEQPSTPARGDGLLRLPAWPRLFRAGSVGSAAPVVLTGSPSLSVASDAIDNGRRKLRFVIRSARGAPELMAVVQTQGRIRASALDGRSLDRDIPVWRGLARHVGPVLSPDRRRLRLWYFAVPDEGVMLDLEIDAVGPVRVDMLDRSYDIPDTAAGPDNIRPPSAAMPAESATVIVRSFVL